MKRSFQIVFLYLMQASAMLVDLIFLSMLGVFLYSCSEKIFSVSVALLISIVAFAGYCRHGGFMAWKPKTIKMFLSNLRMEN